MRYYAACDALIMPSRREAFGLTAVEAMQFGKPVIASNRGALPELVQDGVNGYVFDLDSEDGLKNCLLGLSKEGLRRMSGNAREVFHSSFTAARMVDETEKYLMECRIKTGGKN